MRSAFIVGLVLLIPLGSSVAEPATTATPTLWDRAFGPDAGELREIITHARSLHRAGTRPSAAPDDDELRGRLLADARGMLSYARRNLPEDTEIIELYAQIAEAQGDVEGALAAYRRHAELALEAGALSAESCNRHALFLSRLGRRRDAISRLRTCADRGTDRSAAGAATIIHLANLLIEDGELVAATALLRRSADPRTGDPLLRFALAVAYDKDEQLNRACEVLEQLASRHQVPTNIAHQLNTMPFTPTADRHYFRALFYEVSGNLPEAREEWHNYARSGDTRHAHRARQHLRALRTIDAMETIFRPRRRPRVRSRKRHP